MWFIGVEVEQEQETSAPPPEKKHSKVQGHPTINSTQLAIMGFENVNLAV